MVRLLAVLVLAAGYAHAVGNWEYYGDWEYYTSWDVINGSPTNHAITIRRYLGTGGDLTIPESINGTPVRTIGVEPPGMTPLFFQAGPSQGYPVYGNYTVTSLVIPSGVTRIASAVFQGSLALTNVTVPDSVTSIGANVFANCPNITSVTLPPQFMADSSYLGLIGSAAASNLVQSLANSLSTNTTFISNVAQAILAASNNYGLATKTEVGGAVTMGVQQVLSAPSDYNLFTTQQVQDARTAGQNNVLNTPNSFSLYTTNQIHNLGLGGIVLNRNTNNQLVLKYQVLQSTDLQSWTPYQHSELVISNAPSDKMFLRVQAIENVAFPSQSDPLPDPLPGQPEGEGTPTNGPSPNPAPPAGGETPPGAP